MEIYGDVFPQLINNLSAAADEIKYQQVTVSFKKWNQEMPGTIAPTRYIVALSGETKPVQHNSSDLGRVSLTWNGLEQGGAYTFTVKCQIEGVDCPGPQPTFTASTKACSAPAQPVLIWDKQEFTNNGRQRWLYNVSWMEPEANCYGALTYLYRVNSRVQERTNTMQATFYMDGFESFTFRLQVKNSAEISSSDVVYRNTSAQLRPQFGSSTLNIASPNSSCVTLTWTKPQYPSGTVNMYKIKCGEKDEHTVSNFTTSTTSCDHLPYTNITCTLIASNDAGDSTPLNGTVTTQCNAPTQPSFTLSSYVYNETDVALQVVLQRSQPQCKLIKNYAVQIQSSAEDVQVINMLMHGIFSITGLQAYTTYTVSVTAVNNMNLTSYAEETLTTPELYTPGAPQSLMLNENGSCIFVTISKPLQPNGLITHFLLKCNEELRVIDVSNEGDVSTEICNISTGVEVSCSATANNSLGFGNTASNSIFLGVNQLTTSGGIQAPIGAIAGGAVGGVVLAVVCLVIVIYCKRRGQKKKKENDSSLDVKMEGIDSAPAAATKPLVAQPPAKPTFEETEEEENHYGNASDASLRRSEPIPIEKLHWYNSTNNAAIMIQYNNLEKLPKPNMSEALLPENKGKCRYRNLYPSNTHRVKLVRGEGEGTDFINASYMRGYYRERQYIAAQGPFTDAVVEDFWLMIWQQQPTAIVMVTKAVEYSKMKCLQYWPTTIGSSSSYGDINVTMKSTESWSDYAASQFIVTKDGERREIPHFIYSSWPDHGVPDLEVFITFHRLINSTIGEKGEKPLLLHCSAGVGRTGTYIALDYLIDQAKNEGSVDMFECVKEMRSRRPCMLQTDEQYIFLHHVLYETLATEGFACPSTNLDSKINRHFKHPNSKTDQIVKEYQHILERIQSLEFSYVIGREPDNRQKNRFSEILPPDAHMPFLSAGSHGTYINAVFVDGYRDKKQWVATQFPLSQTAINFWQLILEQDIKFVVQLESSQKPFYPTKDSTSLEYGDFIINRVSSVANDSAKTITVNMEHPQGNLAVIILVVKQWPKDGLPTTDVIISVHTAVERLQQKTSSAAICVTCLDGSSRCGLYICAHNAIEKLKVEQQVDLYNPTVLAKLRRPQFIPTIGQYEHLYLTAKDYLSSFSEYANFN